MSRKSMMPRQTTSIKRDILLGAIALLAILGIGLFLYVRNFSLNAADIAFDRVLAASALSIADSIRVEDGHLTLEMPLAALEILGAARDNRAFYAVRAPDHSLVTGYPDLPDEPRGLNDHSPRFFDATYSNDPVRVGSIRRYIDFGEHSGWVSVTVVETREARTQLAAQICRNSFAPMALAGLIICLLISKGLNRAWAPLVALETELTQRVPADLTPIRASVPREVASLVSSLNAFMQRLDGVLSTLRGLAVETTHEMRTPLQNRMSEYYAATFAEFSPTPSMQHVSSTNCSPKPRLLTISRLPPTRAVIFWSSICRRSSDCRPIICSVASSPISRRLMRIFRFAVHLWRFAN
jgi:two-component system sensor histidine kinase TctE